MKCNSMHVFTFHTYTQKEEIFHITCLMMHGLWKVKKYFAGVIKNVTFAVPKERGKKEGKPEAISGFRK